MGQGQNRGRRVAWGAVLVASAFAGPVGSARAAVPAGTLNHLVTAVACVPRTTLIDETVTCKTTVTNHAAHPATPDGGVEVLSTGQYTNGPTGSCDLAGSGASASCSVSFTPTAADAVKDDVTAIYAPDSGPPENPIDAYTTLTVRKRPVLTDLLCTIPGGPQHEGTCSMSITDDAPGTETLPGGGIGFAAAAGVTFTGPPCILQQIGPSTNQTFCSIIYHATSNKASFSVTATYDPSDSIHRTARASTTVNPGY